MVDGPRGVPPPETRRIYERNAGIGVSIKAMSDAEQAEKAVAEHLLKRRCHTPMTEVWTFEKPYGKYNQAGRWEVEGVRRDMCGRFARKLSTKEIAAIVGGATGDQIPPPKKKSGRE